MRSFSQPSREEAKSYVESLLVPFLQSSVVSSSFLRQEDLLGEAKRARIGSSAASLYVSVMLYGRDVGEPGW